jgi:hypothetical protein
MAVTGHERITQPPLSFRVPISPWHRLRLAFSVWWRAGELDRRLAAGAGADSSALLAMRAEKIIGPRGRLTVADGLSRALNRAQDGVPGFTAAIRPNGQEVLAAQVVISTLERRLRSDGEVRANGVAMLQLLLTEPASPLYLPAEPGALGSYLRAAAAALEPVD